MPTPNTFKFGEARNVHKLGDENCPACRWDIPRHCAKCGEGLVHIELSSKIQQNNTNVFMYHCDVCAGRGKNWKDPDKRK